MDSPPKVQNADSLSHMRRRLSEAVNTLNFEEAARLTQTINEQQKGDESNSKVDIQAMHDEEVHKLQIAAQQEVMRIDREAAQKSSDCVLRYRELFEQVREKQDMEVNNLADEWEKTHDEAESVARSKVESLLYTSKVMASFNYIDDAKRIRDNAQGMKDSFINKETMKIDKFYKKQFEQMLKKHKVILDGLYGQMKNELEVIKGDCDIAKSVAESKEKISIAKTSMTSMTNIALSSHLSSNEKSSMIASLSPPRSKTFKKTPGFKI